MLTNDFEKSPRDPATESMRKGEMVEVFEYERRGDEPAWVKVHVPRWVPSKALGQDVLVGIKGYTNVNQCLQVGVEIEPMKPVVIGDSFTSFSVRGQLPQGFELDPSTGEITGTPEQPDEPEECIVTPVASNGYVGESFTLKLEVSEGCCSTSPFQPGQLAVLSLYALAAAAPAVVQRVWPPLSSHCAEELQRLQNISEEAETKGLSLEASECRVTPHWHTQLALALAVIIFTKVCFSDMSFARWHRLRHCGAFEWITAIFHCLGWFLVVNLALYEIMSQEMLWTPFQVRLSENSNSYVLYKRGVDVDGEAPCKHFATLQQVQMAVGSHYGGVGVWAFMVGTLVMCLGEMMKLAPGQPYLLRTCADIGSVITNNSDLPASKTVRSLADTIETMTTKLEHVPDEHMEALHSAANIRQHVAKTSRAILWDDVRRVFWPMILQTFGFAVWTSTLHMQQAVENSGCWNFERTFMEGRPVFRELLRLLHINDGSDALWLIQTLGLGIGLVTLAVLLLLRPALWFCDLEGGFLHRIPSAVVCIMLLWFTLSIETSLGDCTVNLNEGICQGGHLLHNLPSRSASVWACKALIAAYIIEFVCRVSLWLHSWKARYVMGFSTGFIAGFVIGWQLSWDLCSLVCLTTGFGCLLGLIACALVRLRVEPSKQELRSFRRVVLDLARARQQSLSSHGFGHRCQICGGAVICIGVLILSAFLLAVILAKSKGCVSWGCWSAHAWPLKGPIRSEPVMHNVTTTQHISANTTMAAKKRTYVEKERSATDDSNSSVIPRDREYVEIILHNQTCQGKLVNEQLGFKALRADSLEMCQLWCASSQRCRFVQFEDVEGICSFYEDCTELRECGKLCGRTFRYQDVSGHKQ
jgi:hypothetical protein